MSLLTALAFGTSLRDGPNFSNPAVPIDSAMVSKLFGDGGTGAAKVQVNSRTAMGLPAMLRGVNLLSCDVGRLPLYTYRRLEEDGKEKATEHPSYYLVARAPNRYQTPSRWKRTMIAQAMTKRGGYSYIVRDGAARPVELLPLDPDGTTPVIQKRMGQQRLLFITRIGEDQITLLAENVLHIFGYSDDGITGKSVIDMAREFLGTGIAQQRYAGHYYGQGAKVGGFLMFPGHVEAETREQMTKEFNEDAGSLEKSHEVVLLEDGVKFQNASFNPRDSQFIEGQQFTNRQISQITGVPVHKLGDTETTPYASRQEANQEYLDESLDPWLRQIEEECWTKLLTEEEKRSDSHVIEFRRADLMRANTAEQAQADAIYLDRRTLLPNEVRNRMNLNPIDGGDEPLAPLNMQPTGEQQPVQDPPSEPAPTEEPRADVVDAFHAATLQVVATARDSVEAILEDSRNRMFRRLALAAMKASRKPMTFSGWIDSGILDDHMATVREVLDLPVRTLAKLDKDPNEESLVNIAASTLFGEFRNLLDPVVNDHTPLSLPAQVREAVAKFLPEEAA